VKSEEDESHPPTDFSAFPDPVASRPTSGWFLVEASSMGEFIAPARSWEKERYSESGSSEKRLDTKVIGPGLTSLPNIKAVALVGLGGSVNVGLGSLVEVTPDNDSVMLIKPLSPSPTETEPVWPLLLSAAME